LNYSDPQGTEAIIALIRKPSTLAESSPEYRGPLLFNPGGPGGSGVEFIHEYGDVMSSIIGPQFDIVSFDPRGMCHQCLNILRPTYFHRHWTINTSRSFC
jgi:pimeloyl-ACP methyl ester carboxylesterase